jgi:biotin-(acetyl-CoA carboxylase) ligase
MNNKEITGIACGIDESGALQLIDEDGTLRSIKAGDVTLKK